MQMIMVKEETLDYLMERCLDSLVRRLVGENVPYQAVEKEVREMCDRIKKTAI
jgi:septum formation inhibitor-activating ATPase MinD